MNFGILIALFASVIGDGCLIAAATLAASSGGSAILWGVSFGLSHALFLSLGYSVTDSIANYSEFFADTVVLATLLILLQHYLHHNRSHVGERCCSCNHATHTITKKMIFLYSIIFSLHALGSGALIRQGLGAMSQMQILSCALAMGSIIGTLIALSVATTESYRPFFMKILDSFPGLVLAILFFAISWSTFHMLFEVIGESSYAMPVTIIASLLSAFLGSTLINTKHVEDKKHPARS